MRNLRKPLRNSTQDRLVLDSLFIISLEFGGDAVEGALESVLGGGVDHLGLDTGVIGGPGDEGDLASVLC